jgi:WD40 repeat protein
MAYVKELVFSVNGKFLAATDDYSAQVFDVKTGSELLNLSHQSWVQAIAFSPDGHYLATGSADHTARVFDVSNGKEMNHLENLGNVQALYFAPDGFSLMTACLSSEAGELIVRRNGLRPETLIDEACSRLSRNLTLAEWNQFAGFEEPYRKRCPKLP